MMLIKWKIPLAIMLLFVVTAFITGCSSDTTKISAIRTLPNGEIQTVKLSVDSNYVYSPQVIKVKAGTMLRIEADPKTNVGGMDTIVIDDYGVSKKISAQDNILEFVADTPGTFKIYCANGMGDGKLIVE